MKHRAGRRQILPLVGFSIMLPMILLRPALAQTDEIQVYNAQIAAPGVLNLTLHDNYTPDGLKIPAFPGAIVSNGALNGVPEWAYGVTPWFEAGLYLPLYSVPRHGGPQIDGFKVRALFVEPDAARHSFFYGMNFEFSFNAKYWNPNRYTQELRPILGWRLGKVDIIVNPILDNSWKGFSRLDFAPETRVDYNLSSKWAIALEEYDDFGEIRRFSPAAQQSHQLFAVFDYNGLPIDVEGGIGFGLNSATDSLTLKLILSRDLN
jgi:hypothetical protein